MSSWLHQPTYLNYGFVAFQVTDISVTYC